MTKVKGLYQGEYDLSFREVKAETPKRAFIMPGQGSAYPGMFRDFIATNEHFASLFKFADETSGPYDLLPVSSYIANPGILPQEKIHVYRNCALYTSEVAMGRTLLKKGITVDAITGHSFGECAGLVLSGIFSFEDMFHIVVHRNILCPPANELGFMVTLNGTQEKLKDFLELPGVYLGNLNSPKQLVVSIATAAKDEAMDWLRKNRVPHIILHGLPQPYHSPLMEPYRKKLHERISQLKFKTASPEIPFFSGIFHQWITKENLETIDFVDLLARQLTEPVNFIQQIEALRELGCRRYYEVGPGKMLEPPLKTILGEDMVVYRNVEALLPKDLDQRLLAKPQNEAMKKSRWFGRIKEVLHTVTGYKTDDIDIAHSFQNDLGIDSIKKAEILVKIIREENLNASSDFSVTRFSTIYEAVEYLENYSADEDPLKISHDRLVEAVTPEWQRSGLVTISTLVNNKIPLLRMRLDENFLSQLDMATPSLVVMEGDTSLSQNFPETFLPLYKSYLEKKPSGVLHLCLLDRSQNEALFPVASFLRSLVKENRPFTVSWIHDPEKKVTEAELRAEYSFSTVRDVRYSGGSRYVRNYPALSLTMPEVRKSLRVLALGGSRGINYEILRRFPVITGDELILVGRTKRDDSSIAFQLKTLAESWKKFTYVEADLEKPSSVLNGLKKILNGKVDVVLNAAGREVSQSFEERTEKDIRSEIDSKLLPQVSIAELRKNFEIKRIINFSSIVSQFGNKGQAVYSWSNAILEQQEAPGVTALAWGPWEDVGMTTNLGILQKIREWGISLITPEEGAKLAIRVMLTESELPAVIIPMDRKDVFLFSLEQLRGSVLGKLTDNFEMVFQNQVRIEDAPYLEDHKILGKLLFPVAWWLSQILAYGRSMYSRMVAIENLEVHNMLFLDEKLFTYKLQIFPRSPCDVNIWSYLKHATATVNPDVYLAHEVLPFRQNLKAIDIRSFYDIENFGERFQFMKHAFVDPELRVHVEAKLSESPVLTGNGIFDFWMYILDLSLQTISLQIKTVTGGVIMPVSFGRLIFSRDFVSIGTSVYIYPEVHHQTDSDALASVTLTNEKNEVICRFEKVYVRKHFLQNRIAVRTLT